MANTPTIPVGSIIFESLLSPFMAIRRFLWEAGFFIISTYLLVIAVVATGVLAGGGGASLAVLIVAVVAYGSIAVDFLVRWHRAVVSDDASLRSSFLPRFDRTHFRYFLYLLVVCLLAALVVLIMWVVIYGILSGMRLGAIDRTSLGYTVVTSLIRMGLTVILVAVLGRFLLMLPIVAVGGEEPHDTAALLSRKRELPVALALGGVSLIVMLFQFAFGMLVLAADGSTNQVLTFVGLQVLLMPVVSVLGIAIFASAVTLIYKRLKALQVAEPAASE